MNKDVFTAVCDRLEEEVTDLKWIDFDSGQIDVLNERPALAFPACLVDIAYPQCDDTGATGQIVVCNVTLRLVFWYKGETNSLSPVRETALEIFDIIESVHAALQGWSTYALSNFSRINAAPEKRKDGLKVYKVVYQTTFAETTEL